MALKSILTLGDVFISNDLQSVKIMRLNLKAFLITFISVFFIGCASTPFEAYEQYSHAKNIAIAAGLTHRSGPIEDDEVDVDSSTYSSLDALGDAFLGVEGIMGHTRDAGPITSGGAGHFFLGRLLLNTVLPTKHPAVFPQVFIWMPKADIPEGDAVHKYNEMYLKAYQSLLPDGYSLVTKTKVNTTVFGSPNNTTFHAIEGHECEKIGSDVLNDQSFFYRDLHKKGNYCILAHTRAADPEISMAPSWLGGYEAYTWGMIDGEERVSWPLVLLPSSQILKKTEVDNYFKFQMEMSKRMPEWVYFYEPPNQLKKLPPYILNMGKVHYFIVDAKDKNRR